jgi:hypothetical protein
VVADKEPIMCPLCLAAATSTIVAALFCGTAPLFAVITPNASRASTSASNLPAEIDLPSAESAVNSPSQSVEH